MGRSRSFKEPQAVAGRGIPGPQARNSVYTSSLRFVRKYFDINPSSLGIGRLLKVTGSNWLLILTAVQPTTLVQSVKCALHSSSSGSPCFVLIPSYIFYAGEEAPFTSLSPIFILSKLLLFRRSKNKQAAGKEEEHAEPARPNSEFDETI